MSKVRLTDGDVHQMAQLPNLAAPSGSQTESVEVLPESGRQVIPGLTIRAATIPALVRLTVDTFDCKGHVDAEASALPRVVFQMHRWILASTTLAAEIISLYQESAPDKYPDCCHVGNTCWQLRVCHAIRYWLLNFPMHLDTEEGLKEALEEFQSTLPKGSSCSRLVNVVLSPQFDWVRKYSGRNSLVSTIVDTESHNSKISLVFNNLEPQQIAMHITYMEHRVLRRISFQELKSYVNNNSISEAQNLERSIAMFNGLTRWVQCMVLSRTTPKERADVMGKFIDIGKTLLELQNFNSLMAVIGGVSHSVLARLSRTMDCLSPEHQKNLTDYKDLLSANSNYANYRRKLEKCHGLRIPILGIHLKDLIALHVAQPDILENNLLNVHKLAQLSLIFQELEGLQTSVTSSDINTDLVDILRLSLCLSFTEDEIYELSLAREPRNPSSPQFSPVQSMLFADWASNPCPPPDPQTIEKHVSAMVEAVFKNYDNDEDGFISHEEFDAIASNFPFIASFCVLDADHDGMISKEEMKKYFTHANCHALKSGFKHNFHEVTYFKPTFCIHCAGLLWGLIRQGYKCRDCGINAHRHCKDLVVSECRLKPSPSPAPDHSNAGRRKFRRKKKSSSDSDSSKTHSSSGTLDGDASSIAEHSNSDGGSLPPSPKPTSTTWSTPRRKISDSLLVPSRSRMSTRLKAQNSCPETHLPRTITVTEAVDKQGASSSVSNCYCLSEQVEMLNQRLAAAEEMNQQLQEENQFLRSKLEEAYQQLSALNSQMGEVRQHTFEFILHQMDALRIQKNSHV